MVEKNENLPVRIQLEAGDREFLRLLSRRLRKINWALEKIHEAIHVSVDDSEIELRRAIRFSSALLKKAVSAKHAYVASRFRKRKNRKLH